MSAVWQAIPAAFRVKAYKRGRILGRWHPRSIELRGNVMVAITEGKLAKKRALLIKPECQIRLCPELDNALGQGFMIVCDGHAMHFCVPADGNMNAAVLVKCLTDAGHKAHKLSDFALLSQLGEGGYASVWMVREKISKKLYALKRISKKPTVKGEEISSLSNPKDRNFQAAFLERVAMQGLSHPFIVTLRFAFQDENAWYLCMDLCEGGDILCMKQRRPSFDFPEEIVKMWAAELVTALEHMHSHNLVHRDIKPENILMDSQGHVRLSDFGFTKVIGQAERSSTFCGTKYYCPPEMLTDTRSHGHGVDWWSFGILLYELIVGAPPFYDENRAALFKKITSEPLKFPEDVVISPECRDFISQLCIKDPEKRLGVRPYDRERSSHGLSEVCAHPFFAGVDWSQVESRKVAPLLLPDVHLDHGADEAMEKPVPAAWLKGEHSPRESIENRMKGFSFSEADLDSAEDVGVDATTELSEHSESQVQSLESP